MCVLCGVLLNDHWAEQEGGRRGRVFRGRLLNRVLDRLRAAARRLERPRLGAARPQGAHAPSSPTSARSGSRPSGSPAGRSILSIPISSRRWREDAVVLLTGYLGSGKTTLLSRLLAHPDMGETAVIVNELGEVAIDHHLLRRVDERTVVLGNGCVCCTLRGDLADELRDLLVAARPRRDPRVRPRRRRDDGPRRSGADPLHAARRPRREAPLRARARDHDRGRAARAARRGVGQAGRGRRPARGDEDGPRRSGGADAASSAGSTRPRRSSRRCSAT